MNYRVYYPCQPYAYFNTIDEAICFQARFGGDVYRNQNGVWVFMF